MIVHPIGNWWKTIKHSIAWRLLEVAKNGDYHDRLKAVRQLARIDHLKGKLFQWRIFFFKHDKIFFKQFIIIFDLWPFRLGLSAFSTNM